MARDKKPATEEQEMKPPVIPVHCAHDELWDIGRLVPNPRNPNQHPSAQIEILAKIIRAQGWRAPITVSGRSGFIVRGHGRLQAAYALGLEQVPVDLQQYATEADEWADLVADNRIAELAEMDNLKLRDLLSELDTGAIDMDLTGFDQGALERMMASLGSSFDPGTLEPPDALPDAGLQGEVMATGRFLLVYTNDEERALWCRLLGVDPTENQVVFTLEDCPGARLAPLEADVERVDAN